MQRKLMAIFTPPLAVCRYGCAGCCAAPIAVFWLSGIVSIIYSFFGGPAGIDGFSWPTFALGIALWALAAIWTENTLKRVEADANDPNCQSRSSNICRMVRATPDEPDPLEEIKKYR